MRQPEAPARFDYLDWLRVGATVMVVLLHVLYTPMSLFMPSELGTNRALAYTWTQTALTRWAVPVFLMMTGALLLRPDKPLPWPTLRRYMMRALKALAVFGYVYCILELVQNAGQFAPHMLYDGLFNLLQGKSWSHMWYVYALLGIYLIMPMLKRFAEGADQAEYRRLLMVLFLFSVAIPAINYNFGLAFVTLFQFPVAAFYVLLGDYANRCAGSLRWATFAGTASLLAMFVGETVVLLSMNGYGARFFDYNSPFIVIYSYALFLVAKEHLDRPLPGKALPTIARLSFGIYLIHPVFVNAFNKLFPPMPLPPIALEATQFLIAFAGSALAASLLLRLPGFRSFL